LLSQSNDAARRIEKLELEVETTQIAFSNSGEMIPMKSQGRRKIFNWHKGHHLEIGTGTAFCQSCPAGMTSANRVPVLRRFTCTTVQNRGRTERVGKR
jgi:hypothetical protein